MGTTNATRCAAHEYEESTTEGLIATVAAMYPGEAIVRIDDEFGTDVRLLRRVAGMSEEEHAAVLAGDAVTLENGARVELVRWEVTS